MQDISLVVEENRHELSISSYLTISQPTLLYIKRVTILVSLCILYRHCKFGLLVQKIPLIIIAVTLAIGISLVQQSLTLPFLLKDSATLAFTFFESAFADHGQETTLTLYNSSFGSLTSGGGNQVSVFASYKVNDNSIAGQTINAVVEVYAPNGSLIRTSSYPDGFIAQSSGGVEGLKTTIRDPTLQSVTANVTFRDLSKTAVLSNDLRVNLNLAEEATASATTGEETVVDEDSLGLESEQEQDSSPLQQPDQEGEGGDEEAAEDENDEEQTIPDTPLFG